MSTEASPNERAVRQAVREANSSTCAKSKRGAVIYRRSGEIVAAAHNSPPLPFACTGADACRAHCNKVAIHAEQRAVMRLRGRDRGGIGLDLVHVKTVGGVLVPGGPPSCWQCSRMLVESGDVEFVWLFEGRPNVGIADAPLAAGLLTKLVYVPPGTWRRYDVRSFHEATLVNCGIVTE